MSNEINAKDEIPLKITGHLLDTEQRKRGIFDRIKDLFPFFGPEKTHEKTLLGRIHAQLQQDAHHMREQLYQLKESLRKELDGHNDSHLWASFEAVVDPLLREYGQIEKRLQAISSNIEDKTTTLQKYNEWIDKAKLWVSLNSHPRNREDIIRAVVEHTMHVSDMIIERDLKMLREYITHELTIVDIPRDQVDNVMQRLDEMIKSHIEGLTSLKHNKPDNLKLDELQTWKMRVDEERGYYYNTALHIIDTYLNSFARTPIAEEVQDHLKEIFSRVAYLEEEVPYYIREIEHDSNDEEQWRLLNEKGKELEEEIALLHRDLRLTPELVNRVVELMESLHTARQLFRKTG